MNALRRLAPLFVLALGTPLALGACKKDPPPVPDAGPPPAPSPAPTPSALTDLQPMEPEDAGVDAGADAGKKVATGPAVNANVAKLKQCCAAISAEAKRNATTVEGGMMAAAAVQCNIIASQAGNGSSPEMTAVKNAMKGRSLPAVCAGL